VTTSLDRPTNRRERRTPVHPTLDSFEILPDRPLQTNGVPRSAWTRSRRAATWHRAYATSLVLFDYAAALLASVTAVATMPKAQSGFQADDDLFRRWPGSW
jgi:hypothetical protein